MRQKLINALCDNVGELAIGIGIIASGLTCGVWGYLIGKYDY